VTKLQKQRIAILFAIAAGTTILLPLIFGEARQVAGQTGGDTWRNFIYDFQTLIGGGAAIIAAWVTVHQMRITDQKSESRHEELIALQMRADRLRVERMLHPSLNNLKLRYEAISSWKTFPLKKLVSSEPQSVVYILYDLMLECDDVLKIISRNAFANAAELLDGNMTYAMERLGNEFSKLSNRAERCRDLAMNLARAEKDSIGINVDDIYEKFVDDLTVLHYSRNKALGALEIVCSGLAEMQEAYKIHQ
jgi:hypothetical protein